MTDDELTGRFDGITRQFETVDRQFEAVDRRFDAVDQRFDGVDRRFDGVDRRFEQMEALIREEGAATRLHMDIVAEGLRTEIKVIAEGHGALADKTAVMTSRQDRTDARVDRLENRQLAHEHRLRKLETGGE